MYYYVQWMNQHFFQLQSNTVGYRALYYVIRGSLVRSYIRLLLFRSMRSKKPVGPSNQLSWMPYKNYPFLHKWPNINSIWFISAVKDKWPIRFNARHDLSQRINASSEDRTIDPLITNDNILFLIKMDSKLI